MGRYFCRLCGCPGAVVEGGICEMCDREDKWTEDKRPRCPICNCLLEESCMGTWSCHVHGYNFEH